MTKSPPPALTLVVGGEQFLAERAADQVVAQGRAMDPQTERRIIDASEVGAAGAIAQACSPTLFGGGAVVVVEKAEFADEACVSAILTAASDPAEGVALVVRHAGGPKGKKVLDAVAALSPRRVEAPEIKKGRSTRDFVTAEVRANKRTMASEAQALLIAAVGVDARALAAACSQLAADVEGKEIGADSVRLYFGGTVDITSFEVADAVMAKKGSAALRLLRLAEGTDGARLGPVTVSALANSVRQVVAVSTASPGMPARDLAAAAKVPTWKVDLLLEQSRHWHSKDLARAVLLLSDLDAAVKGGLREGEQLEPVQKGLAMENTVTRLAGRNSSN